MNTISDAEIRFVNTLAGGDPSRCEVGLRAAATYHELEAAGHKPRRLTLEAFVRAALRCEGAPVEPHDLADPPAVPVEVPADERFKLTQGDPVLEDAARRAAEDFHALSARCPMPRMDLARFVRAAVERAKDEEAALRRTGGVKVGRVVAGERLGGR